jgi:hypothetical protein
MDKATGLQHVPEAELVRLLRAIWREQLSFPITRAGLLLAKVGSLESHFDALVGQNKSAAVAILSAVLHERRHRSSARAVGLVWAGPPPSGSSARAPFNVMSELIATAERSVLFTGADLLRDDRTLRSLHAAMRGRSLAVRVVLAGHEDVRRLVTQADALFHGNGPRPTVYVPDPEQLRGTAAQCLVVDSERGVLFAGAAPELEADDRKLTLGLSVHDANALGALESEWQSLIDSGALLPLTAAE